MGGSSKSTTVGYKYNVGIHMVLCHGIADGWLRARVDKKPVWSAPSARIGVISVNLPKLFGGEDREGGIVGDIEIQDGNPSQAANSYLTSVLGATIPAFRGVVGVIFKKVYTGTTPYLKKWDFRVQRIFKRADNAAQWYSGKAGIPYGGGQTTEIISAVHSYEFFQNAVDFLLIIFGQALPSLKAPFGDGTSGVTDPIEGNWPAPNSVWAPYTSPMLKTTFSVPANSTGMRIFGRIENGLQVRVDGIIVGDFNFNGAIDYKTNPPFEFFVDSSLLTPGEHTLSVRLADEASPIPNSHTYFALRAQVFSDTLFGMNPAHIIRECLTDPDWGMGYSEGLIDNASFIAAADTLFNENFGLCMIWDKQEAIEKFIDEVKKHANIELYVDRATGLFNLTLIRADYVIGNLLVLNPSNITKITSFKKSTFGELPNAVTVSYYSTQQSDIATVTVQDIALIQEQGNTILTTIPYRGIPTAALASRVAQRDLATLSTPLISCQLYTTLVDVNFNIGDVFVLDWPEYSISGMVMRVTNANYGDGRSNVVKLSCVQDIFSLPSLSLISDAVPIFDDPSSQPSEIAVQLAMELPYLEAVQLSSQSSVDQLLADNPDQGYVGVAAKRPSGNAINARMFTTADAITPNFQEVATVDFCPTATLDQNLDKELAVFNITNGDDLSGAREGTWLQMDEEVMVFVSLASPVLTVKRGALDTVPALHVTGAAIFFWDEFAEVDPTEYVASDEVYIKLVTVSGSGETAVENAVASKVILNARATRPYPPGDLKFGGNYFPTSTTSLALTLTWAARNRLQQTGSTLIGFLDGPITAEAGVTYTVRVYNDVPTLLDEQIGITASTADITFPDAGVFKIEVLSVRDGYESYQKHEHYLTVTAQALRATEDLDTRATEEIELDSRQTED
jgi:hypothetical protein